MDLQRSFFVFGMFFILFLIWEIWKSSLNVHVNQLTHKNYEINLKNYHSENNIFITTDVFHIKINLNGGDIEKVQLLNFKNTLNSPDPFVLLDIKDNFLYHTISGITETNNFQKNSFKKKPTYMVEGKFFKLDKNKTELRIPLIWISNNGIKFVKTFIFKPNSYDIKLEYKIYNNTNRNIDVVMFGGLRQTISMLNNKNSENISLQTFRGAAYSTDNLKYEKYSFDSILKKNNLNVTTHNGWVAMLQQYFAAAWIPDNTQTNTFYTTKFHDDIAEIGFYSNVIHVEPHSQKICISKLWIGPKIQEKMAVLVPNLDLTIDYGFLWFLSQPLFKLLKFLNNIVRNWGTSIILITLIMRGIMYPLTKFQYQTMNKMKELQPKIDKIKKDYSDDKRKASEKMLLLYKKEKVNPMGGCVPMLIQMPIFLALYYMLVSSVELRHAPFILWIKDLSSQDPYYVLPILMGFTMFLIQHITPNNNSIDSIQKNIAYIVPVIFTLFFLWFPSGLVLYYIVSNLVTIIQQKFILNRFSKIKI
ncbi:MAG: membrane protein insertase YidC [Buchnera aphidicola (Nurudea yanoniella)]